MKSPYFLLLALCALFSVVCAWEKEDHEIFDLVSALQAAEGAKTSFYSYLNVTDKATAAQISKAYRKRSLELHPDKNPNVKNSQERYSRLGVIAGILRDADKKKRYDYFYKTGVPKWKGTGYFYSRFRPGLGSVLFFLALMSTLLHYLIQLVTAYNERQKMKVFQQSALLQAYGTAKPTSNGSSKRMRMSLSRLHGDEKDNKGPMIDLLVVDDKVFLLDEDSNELPLDESAVPSPAWSKTWIPTLVQAIIAKATGQSAKASPIVEAAEETSRPSTPTLSKSKKRKNAAAGRK